MTLITACDRWLCVKEFQLKNQSYYQEGTKTTRELAVLCSLALWRVTAAHWKLNLASWTVDMFTCILIISFTLIKPLIQIESHRCAWIELSWLLKVNRAQCACKLPPSRVFDFKEVGTVFVKLLQLRLNHVSSPSRWLRKLKDWREKLGMNTCHIYFIDENLTLAGQSRGNSETTK